MNALRLPSQLKKSLGGRLTVLAVLLLVGYALCGFLLFSYCPSVRIMLFVAAGMVAVVGIWAWNKFLKRDERQVYTRLFPVVFLVVGAFYLVFFGPNNVPDERYHYGHTYGYADLITPGADAHEIRTEDLVFTQDEQLFSRLMTPDSLRAMSQRFGVFATHEGTTTDEQAVGNLDFSVDLPYVRLPGALGILLSKMLNLSGPMLFYVGRAFCFLFNAALVIAAVRLTPFGKNILMAVAMLPMSLTLLASYSYDGPYLGMAMLTLALIMRVAFGEERASTRLLVGCVVMAALLAPCKVIYSVLLLPALFIPERRFASRKAMLCWKACMVIAPLVSIMIVKLSSIAQVAGVSTAAPKLDERKVENMPTETGQFYTISDLIAHPLNTVLMLMRTLFEQMDGYLIMTVGGSLGQLQPELHMQQFQVYGYWLLLGMATASSFDDSQRLSLSMRAACIVAFFLSGFAAMLSMLMGWTFTTEHVVQGMQGRYLLPVLPALLMGLKGRLVRIGANFGTALLMCMGSFGLVCLAQMLFFVLGGFGVA